jgi:hypothetical protein
MVKSQPSFGGTCRLHPQNRRISQAINQREADSKEGPAYYPLYAGFLIGLFFELRDVPLKRRLIVNGLHGVMSWRIESSCAGLISVNKSL